MEQIVNPNTAATHWAEALAYGTIVDEFPEENREKVRACLNLFSLARSYYSDSAAAYENEIARLCHLGAMAALYRAAFFGLAEMLGGRNDHAARSDALKRLCDFSRWARQRGKTHAIVLKQTDAGRQLWEEVAPTRYTSEIFATHKAYRDLLKTMRTKAEAAQQKRKDKYDKPDGESEADE